MNQKPLCVNPWFHQLVRSDGTARPCCAWNENVPVDHGFEGFFESDFMENLRQEMLSDTVPEGCKMCVESEAMGGVSNRWIAEFRARSLGINVDNPSPILKSQEVDISNVCNLKCRTCDSSRSTKWIADEIAWGITPFKLQNSGWKLSGTDPNTIEMLTFLGGEPLLHQDQIALELKKVKDAGKLGMMRINLNCNMTVPFSEDLIALLAECKVVSMNASVDGYGKLNDYIRSDSDWETITANMLLMEEICKRHSNFEFRPISVASILNCNKFDEIYSWFDDNFSVMQIPTSPIFLWEPNFYAMNNLPIKIKEILQKRYSEWMVKMPKYESHISALSNYVSRPADYGPGYLRKLFWKHTNFLDQRRHASFKDANPEMAEWLS